MRAGPLRHRAVLERPVGTQNVIGEEEARFEDAGERWVSVEPLRGQELFAAQQVQAEVTHRVRMRFMAGTTAKWRLRLADGSRLDILAVLDPRGLHHEQELLCRALRA